MWCYVICCAMCWDWALCVVKETVGREAGGQLSAVQLHFCLKKCSNRNEMYLPCSFLFSVLLPLYKFLESFPCRMVSLRFTQNAVPREQRLQCEGPVAVGRAFRQSLFHCLRVLQQIFIVIPFSFVSVACICIWNFILFTRIFLFYARTNTLLCRPPPAPLPCQNTRNPHHPGSRLHSSPPLQQHTPV